MMLCSLQTNYRCELGFEFFCIFKRIYIVATHFHFYVFVPHST